MKNLARTITVLAALFSVLSCSMDSLYIQLPGTSWCISQDQQRGFIHFEGERLSLLQRDAESGAVSVEHGTYTAKGHAVRLSTDNGNSYKAIRTFSHLKNSSNKNYSRLWPETYDPNHTVWHTLYKDSLRILYLQDGKLRRYNFANLPHTEGIPYGWSQSQGAYSVAGNQVNLGGDETGTLFSEVMLVKDHWYMHYPVQEDTGCSSIAGSFWTLETSGYPGCILFDSNSTFTRILVSNNMQYKVSRGTYTQEGDLLTMTLDGNTEECPVEDGHLTFFGKTYNNLK